LTLRVGDAAERRAHVRSDTLLVFVREVEIGVGERQLRSDHGELREPVESFGALGFQVIGRHEVVDLRGVVTSKLRRIEP